MAVNKRVELPIKDIGNLLKNNSLENTWKSLILTHAQKSHPETTSSLILESDEFKNVKILDKDYLENLTIGEIGILYEYSLAYVNPSSRKNSGQYFTPDDVAEWMVEHSKKFPEGIWLDPCSGIGNLSYPLAKIQNDPEKFIVTQLILSDMDSLALLIARALFTLKFHKNNDNLFNDLKSRMIEQNFLETTNGLPEKIQKLKPDFVIVNPPYAAYSDDRWETKQARDLYAFFLEVIIKNTKGYISITPQSYTNGTKFHVLRKLILKNFNKIDIYNFDNVPDSIFKGIKFGSTNTNTANSVRASIMIAQKTKDNKPLTRITPLLRWTSAEREKIWKKLDSMLLSSLFKEEIFPKNYNGLTKLYNEISSKNWIQLKDLISPKPTAYALTIPSTPRYFITATKRKLTRSSYHTLYFKNSKDLNIAYMYLNSSLTYWWWRVNDGGMTLSTKTLLTLPIPKNAALNNVLIKKLETSEINNLVTKMNAGKPQENVKHPLTLIQEINEKLFNKETADKLLLTHKNSNF